MGSDKPWAESCLAIREQDIFMRNNCAPATDLANSWMTPNSLQNFDLTNLWCHYIFVFSIFSVKNLFFRSFLRKSSYLGDFIGNIGISLKMDHNIEWSEEGYATKNHKNIVVRWKNQKYENVVTS